MGDLLGEVARVHDAPSLALLDGNYPPDFHAEGCDVHVLNRATVEGLIEELTSVRDAPALAPLAAALEELLAHLAAVHARGNGLLATISA